MGSYINKKFYGQPTEGHRFLTALRKTRQSIAVVVSIARDTIKISLNDDMPVDGLILCARIPSLLIAHEIQNSFAYGSHGAEAEHR